MLKYNINRVLSCHATQDRIKNDASKISSNIAHVFVVAGTCLLSRCLVRGSLPSNDSGDTDTDVMT
jgi:nitrate reductase cytochrome c-type subunit